MSMNDSDKERTKNDILKRIADEVSMPEEWIINTLKTMGVRGLRLDQTDFYIALLKIPVEFGVKFGKSPEEVLSDLRTMGFTVIRPKERTYLEMYLSGHYHVLKQKENIANNIAEIAEEEKPAPKPARPTCPLCGAPMRGDLTWREICSDGGLQHRLWDRANHHLSRPLTLEEWEESSRNYGGVQKKKFSDLIEEAKIEWRKEHAKEVEE